MPIYANADAKEFWNRGHARSLAATRFATLKTLPDGSIDDSYRKENATEIQKGAIHPALLEKRDAFNALLEKQGAATIHAKLEARLILNAGDGVIENGGICLDRHSGVPYIPGSAIKGCARRHAVWKLSQVEDVEVAAEELAELCLLFGYGDQEWKAGRDPKRKHSRSDFWLAMIPIEDAGELHDARRDERWRTVATKAQSLIRDSLQLDEFPKQLSGSVAFLPAFPEKDPGIDLDILTCHHPDYYKRKKDFAIDDEAPNPLVFPTIAKGASFRFNLLLCQRFGSAQLLNAANGHLSEGLQIFGLGAKTNAGYGWFSVDQAAARRHAEKREKQAQDQAWKTRRESMTEEELIAEDFQELGQAEFARVVGNLGNEPPDKQKIACQMLAGSQKMQWKTWAKQKKGKWIERVPRIREIAKTFDIELP